MGRSFVWVSAMLAAVSTCFIVTTFSTVTAEPLSVGQSAEPAAGSTGQIPPEIKDARSRFQNGDNDGALAALDKAIKTHPDLPPADIIMAQFCLSARQLANSHDWLEKATVDNPEDPESYVMLGQMSLQGKSRRRSPIAFRQSEQIVGNLQGRRETQSGNGSDRPWPTGPTCRETQGLESCSIEPRVSS